MRRKAWWVGVGTAAGVCSLLRKSAEQRKRRGGRRTALHLPCQMCPLVRPPPAHHFPACAAAAPLHPSQPSPACRVHSSLPVIPPPLTHHAARLLTHRNAAAPAAGPRRWPHPVAALCRPDGGARGAIHLVNAASEGGDIWYCVAHSSARLRNPGSVLCSHFCLHGPSHPSPTSCPAPTGVPGAAERRQLGPPATAWSAPSQQKQTG